MYETSLSKVTLEVAVRSDGTVVTAVTGAETICVLGMTIVSFVVGGSVVEVKV